MELKDIKSNVKRVQSIYDLTNRCKRDGKVLDTRAITLSPCYEDDCFCCCQRQISKDKHL
jgi:hypothetical protein